MRFPSYFSVPRILLSGHVNLLPVSMVAQYVYMKSKMTKCSEAFASVHVNLLPVSMVAPSVCIQGQMSKCSKAFASGHVNLLPVSMVAQSVYIKGKMTKCSEAFASGHVNLLPVSMAQWLLQVFAFRAKCPNAPRLLLQGMSISINLPPAMPMPRLNTSFLLPCFTVLIQRMRTLACRSTSHASACGVFENIL